MMLVRCTEIHINGANKSILSREETEDIPVKSIKDCPLLIFKISDDYGKQIFASTEEDIFCYLQDRLKKLDDNTRKNWQFVQHPYKRLAMFLEVLPDDQKFFGEMAQMAVDQGVDLLEVCTGEWTNPHLFLITADLKIGSLKREWIKLFCKAHGLRIQLDENNARMQWMEQEDRKNGIR